MIAVISVVLIWTIRSMVNSILSKYRQKRALLKVIAPDAYWSYNLSKIQKVPDSYLIEAVLIHGNDALRKRLFSIYPSSKIRKVWEKEIVIRGNRYDNLNKKIASDYLHIANPEKYIERAYSKYNLYDRFSPADA